MEINSPDTNMKTSLLGRIGNRLTQSFDQTLPDPSTHVRFDDFKPTWEPA